MSELPVRDLLEALIARAMVNHASRGAPKLIEISVYDAERILVALEDTNSVNVFGDTIVHDEYEPAEPTPEQAERIAKATEHLKNHPLAYTFDGPENFGTYKPALDDHGGYDEHGAEIWPDDQPDVTLPDEHLATLMAIHTPAPAQTFVAQNGFAMPGMDE